MTAGHCKSLFVLQFHIAKGNKAQRTPLPVTLVLPDHSSLLNRFQDAATKLQETQFAYDQKDTHQITVTDPWGQLFVIVPPSDKSVFNRGIKTIPLPCAPGTAAAIGDFYEQVYKVQLVSLRLVCLVLLSWDTALHMMYLISNRLVLEERELVTAFTAYCCYKHHFANQLHCAQSLLLPIKVMTCICV